MTSRRPPSSSPSRGPSRRRFLQGGAALGAAALTGCLPDVDGLWKGEAVAPCGESPARALPALGPNAGRVVELHDPALVSETAVDARRVGEALTRVLLALARAADLRAACRALFPSYKPGEVVGIKVNVLNARVPTQPALVKALVDALRSGLGLAPEQLLVWDRRLDELRQVQLGPGALGATVEGTWETPEGKGAGRGYELGATCIGGRSTHLSNIVTRRVDHLVNLAVMKNHKAAGFTGVLKNVYGLIDNPGDFHDRKSGEAVLERRFEEAIPAINALPEVGGKTRLYLLDALIGVCKGDTSDPPDCTPARLLAALDPVALDVRGRQLRDEARGPRLGPSTETISSGWLAAAERAGLGSPKVKLEPAS
ncbi:MAG: DUF362 domain-containing protein [Deltaproteobacteria bacterium]|nr:DUF362 domain-containing protein [Deltaproteobacteria bacterium]